VAVEAAYDSSSSATTAAGRAETAIAAMTRIGHLHRARRWRLDRGHREHAAADGRMDDAAFFDTAY
jgi:hypothetical protein